MLTINVQADVSSISRKLLTLQRDVRDKAAVMAINKTVDKARAEMARAITQEYKISSADVRSALNVRRASVKGYNLVASLEAFGSRRKGRSLNVIHFVERKVSMAEGRRRARKGTIKQIGFQFKRGGGTKFIPGAFIGNDGRTVFMRTGDSRLPIVPVQTIDIQQMFNYRKINQRVVDKIQQDFPIEFERAMRYLLSRF